VKLSTPSVTGFRPTVRRRLADAEVEGVEDFHQVSMPAWAAEVAP
jgi:hypothetical protein